MKYIDGGKLSSHKRSIEDNLYYSNKLLRTNGFPMLPSDAGNHGNHFLNFFLFFLNFFL